jgi:hypothetical protein
MATSTPHIPRERSTNVSSTTNAVESITCARLGGKR